MLKQIHHKKNELLEVELYKDKKCTEDFDFTNAENLYIDGQFDLQVVNYVIEDVEIEDAQIFIPYVPQGCVNSIISAIISRNCDNKEPSDYDDVKVLTLSNIDPMWDDEKIKTITPNLSKYIPEDNAVLFLSEEDCNQQRNAVCNFRIKTLNQDFRNVLLFCDGIIQETNTGHINLHYTNTKKITIFIPHGTQAELQKANEVVKELQEKYGVEEVNLFALHCFAKNIDFTNCSYLWDLGSESNWNISKITTTNSTGILEPQNNERLQVIDCKEMFEEYLKTER